MWSLPLAIVVLGGLLSTKKPQEWNLVRDDIWRHLRNDSILITQFLALSFNDLPYQLKLCFLYLSNFPEDWEINTERLIHLWVAEGYIPHDEEIMEDVAHNYLNELINRSLIQKGEMRFGMLRTCRVHDLLRDLAIQKAKELNLVQIYDEIRNSAHSSKVSCRRLAIYSGNNGTSWLKQCNPLLRSLLIFDLYGKLSTLEQFIPTLCRRFRFLRVLEFEHRGFTRICSLPEDIDKLIHLKYLGFEDGLNIPKSILNLSNLETLHFTRGLAGGCDSLPTELWKLKSLRHLIGDLTVPLRIDNMTNLQTLKNVDDNTWTKTNPETLVNLRELFLSVHNETEKFTFDSIAKLKSIQILSVELSNDHFFPPLQPLSHCRYLRHLKLDGKMEKLPGEMHVLLPNVESLSLEIYELVDDPMPILEKMLNLTELELGRCCYRGKKMVCTAKGFPRLEILTLHTEVLEVWQIEEGALPVLRGLRLEKHSQLKLPERLESVPLLPWC